MTKTFRYIIFLIATFIASPAMYAADTLDSDGYPVMYVRGHSTNNWSALDEYKFSRDGDVYTIHLDALDGEFKISGDNWQYNLGGHERTDITRSIRIQGVSDGKNFNAPNLRALTISFKLLRENGAAGSSDITFTVGGAEIAGISGTLPVLYIDVYRYDSATGEPILDEAGNRIYDNEVIDKDLSHKNYFAGEYRLDVNGCQWLTDLGAASIGSEEAPLPLEIKARGNFTRRAFAKKPFKLKLGKKQNLLNMNVNGKGSKHWAILAHADDTKGYLRNFTGFALGERIGLPWTPRQQPIEVVINGDYRGLYFLTESIRVGDGRVPVEELDDNEENRTLISGGYIVELDNYDEDESSQIQMEEKGKSDQFKDMLRITFDTPEEYSALQRRFISEQFTAINDLIGDDSDDMWRYLDLDDAARYYIVEEIISHTESYHGSTYLMRDRGEGEKWHFSPLWDCGNGFNGYTDAYFYDCDSYGNTWIPSLRMNAMFNAKVKDTWQWFMGKHGGFDGLMEDIDAYCAHIADAAKADARRWKGQPVPADGQEVADNSDMESCRNAVKRHLNAKINWLAQQSDFGPVGGDYNEPARDTTPAQPLPYYAKEPEQTVTVYFIDDSGTPWSDVYAYVYDPTADGSTENYEALGQWPGTRMTAAEVAGANGMALTFEPERPLSADAKIIINGGDEHNKTIDFPLVDGNIYYRSGDFTGVETITDDQAEAEAEYYDTSGRRIAGATPRGIYIVRRGDKVSKTLMK